MGLNEWIVGSSFAGQGLTRDTGAHWAGSCSVARTVGFCWMHQSTTILDWTNYNYNIAQLLQAPNQTFLFHVIMHEAKYINSQFSVTFEQKPRVPQHRMQAKAVYLLHIFLPRKRHNPFMKERKWNHHWNSRDTPFHLTLGSHNICI